MKRWIWTLILGLTLGVAACGKKEESKPAPAQPAAPEQPSAPTPPPAEPAPGQ